MKINHFSRTGIEWNDFYYIFWWNPLPKGSRYWGRYHMWYDGPHKSFGLWYTNITWRLPWTSTRFEDYTE
jgi:hypothetical protein